MKKAIPIISTYLDEISQILKENKVKQAFAFGSIITPKFNNDSDIDLLISFESNLDPVEYGDNYFNIIERLEALLKRKVDIITDKSLSNPYFIKSINKTKTPIYEG
jgi:uncharacterized protein